MSGIPSDERGGGERGGRVLAGRYRLLGELGHGGMGVVWRARDEVLGREVAVKEVRAPSGLLDREVRQLYARLEREGRAAGAISHPNVVTVHDVVSQDGRPWIVMELIRGLSLAEVLDAERTLSPARAARIAVEVLAALRAAHLAGVLHRDVKPGNVLLANDGRVVLTDFGIAIVEGSTALTMTGELVGSPEFLAPERILGERPGPASDLWSLGVTLYAAVEGISPFRRESPLSTMRAVVEEEPPPPRRAGPLGPVLDGLLRKDPALRADAAATEPMLRTAAAGGTPRAAPPPTVPAFPPPASPTARTSVEGAEHAAGGTGGGPGQAAGPPRDAPGGDDGPPADRRGRRRAAVAAGVLAAVLVAGGITWALVAGDGSDGGSGGGSASSGAAGGKGDNPAAGGSTSGSRSGSGSGGAGGGAKAGSVAVSVTAARDQYTGACPPPAAEAPYFVATLTVGSVPARVSYHWITGSGKVTDGGWKSVRIDGAKSRTVAHAELNYHAGATDDDWIAVEVRDPARVTSRRVPFSVSCEQAPTGGASSAASAGTTGGGPTAGDGPTSAPGESGEGSRGRADDGAEGGP
ncbi:serine/threonine-protein kinase [Streptomyces varsoviensis]|uniref:serine/threonine-protein kinase n=1 Tax=Streptomyces varsoviensis TaxID=67373 RepID=UPI0033D3FC3E